jgi:phosphoglycolate phosphatase
MKKLVIFDLDGTLLDTIEDLANSANFALALHGFPTHPVESYRFFVGNGMNNLLLKALPEHAKNNDTVAMVKKDFLPHYFEHNEQSTKPYPGIIELLHKLDREGIKMAIASNKIHLATQQLALKYFPNIPFVSVLGQRENVPIKPNSAILDEIIATVGVEKLELIYVGDSGVDVATAYNAKVPFVGVLWGFRPRKELEEVGATQFVANTDELYEFIINK